MPTPEFPPPGTILRADYDLRPEHYPGDYRKGDLAIVRSEGVIEFVTGTWANGRQVRVARALYGFTVMETVLDNK